jgi:predicted permease
MFKNYILSSFRAIRQSSIYGLLNIAGLAMGMAFAGLNFLWVEKELQFDHQYAKHNQLYSIRLNMDNGGKLESNESVPGPMAKAIRGTIPGLVNNCRFGFSRVLFGVKDYINYADGAYVDTSFFSMMQLPFVSGNTAGFDHPHTIVLTEKMAQQFFGAINPTGKTVKLNNAREFVVIGVIGNPPLNSRLQFDWLAPIANYLENNTWLEPWGNFGIFTLVELSPGTDVNRVNQALSAILQPKNKIYAHSNCRLWSMNDWHLRNNFINGEQNGGAISVVKLIAAIAWIILIMGCINFMNLSTTRAGQRAREIGVRKTLGAQKQGLITQFLIETLIMAFMATLLAVLLIYALLPGFNRLMEEHLRFEPLAPAHLLALFAIGTICGLVAGSYPAFYLSSFQPVAVLRGQRVNPGGGAGFTRRGLVVVQFTIAVFLIIYTIVSYQQVQHLRNRDLGFDKEALVYASFSGNLAEHFNILRTQLLQTGAVDNVALSSSPPLEVGSATSSSNLTWEGSDPSNTIKINMQRGSPEYLVTMGMTLLQGRDFHADIRSDSGDIIINERLARLMGKAGKPGATLTYNNGDRFHVIGIVKNFLFNNVIQSVEPLIITCRPESKDNYRWLNIRLRAGSALADRLGKVKAVVKANNPDYPFDYLFTDEAYSRRFGMEDECAALATIFAILAIFISCLGLLGLAAYTAERRMREIGIRKVLGASVSSLAALLSSEFLRLVVLACLIAIPLVWWALHVALAYYPDRVPFHWWVFGLAASGAILIALLTVSFQAIRAALMNPVKTLRAE